MRLLLDEGLSYRAAAVLRQARHDAAHVYDLDLASTADELLIELARRDGQVIVTFDGDFHALLARQRATQPSVIRIRRDAPHYEDQARLIEDIVQRHRESLLQGAAVSVGIEAVRVRKLPLP